MIWGWGGDGDLLLCQHGQRRIVNFKVSDVSNGSIPTEKVTVVADMFEGKPLNSPNDMMLVSGKLFFTDPPFGLKYTDDVAGGMDLRKNQTDDGVYLLTGLGGTVTKLPVTIAKPNGIAWSDGNVFVASTPPSNGFYMFSTIAADPTTIRDPCTKLKTTPANGVTIGYYDGFTALGRYVLGAGVGGVYILEGATGSYMGFLANPGITNLHIGGGYLWLMRNAGPPRLLQRVKINPEVFQRALKSSPSDSGLTSGTRATRGAGVFMGGGFAGALSIVLNKAC